MAANCTPRLTSNNGHTLAATSATRRPDTTARSETGILDQNIFYFRISTFVSYVLSHAIANQMACDEVLIDRINHPAKIDIFPFAAKVRPQCSSEMNLEKFFTELKRRNVYKVAVAYAVVAWLLIQVATQVFPFFEVPNWAVRLVVLLIIIGFPIALVIAWAFELTPEGLKRTEVADAAPAQRSRSRAWIYVVLIAGALSAGLFFLGRFTASTKQSVLAEVPSKSIAVLPFDNLSRDPDNAYFASGIQDEIITRLAKIADLKVISRTSTQQYQSKPGNLSEIAKQLGVANILEGSVQKAADQVRVNVQLIQVASDSHLWADTYDRKLVDIFAVESEMAKAIADALQAKLTGGEQQALAAKPTNNSEAYDAYLRGLALEVRASSPADSEKVVGFYEQSVQLDPTFALAWARLSRANSQVYFGGLESTPARRDAAERALNTAQKLQPNSPETLLAQAYYQYWVLRDYELAKTTFGRVKELVPGSSDVPAALALIARRQGQWDQSVAYWQQTLALDPRNTQWLANAGETYAWLRQFPAALKTYDRVLDIIPNDPNAIASEARVYQAEGNLEQAGKLLAGLNQQTHSFPVLQTKINQLFLERHCDEAVRWINTRLTESRDVPAIERLFDQGSLVVAQECAGDIAGARATAQQMLPSIEKFSQKAPNSPPIAAGLSLVHAFLGDKDEAIKQGERAIALLPSAKDAVDGPSFEEQLAFVEALVGDKNRAISTLQHLLEIPYHDCVTPALLRLDPKWDSLRGDPRFQKLCEEKKQ